MRLRSIVCLILVLILGMVFSGCTNNPDATDPVATTEVTPATPETPEVEPATISPVDADREVIALVNGDPAYRDEFEAAKGALLNQYAQTYAQFGIDVGTLLAGADGRMFELGIEAESLMQLVQLILTQQEAAHRDIVISDEALQAEMDSQYGQFLAGQGWTEADLALYLVEQGRTVESFQADVIQYIFNQMMAMEVQKAVAGPIEVTDEELNEHFLANKANYEVIERVRASHILVETLEEAEALMTELNEGADFAALAREHSTDPGSGANGGDLNWFGRGSMVGPFEEAVFALAIGEISEIITTDFGYHIILLTDREEASVPELADVRDQVQTDLEEQKSYAAALLWYESTYAAANIVINEPLLSAIVEQTDDIEGAIEILEQVKEEGTSDDRYLSYVLGTFYERKLTDRIEEKASAELAAAEGTETDTDISVLASEIEALQAKTLEAYQQALEDSPREVAIQTKITEIEALSGGIEDPLP
jgi:foldase protein PrsA